MSGLATFTVRQMGPTVRCRWVYDESYETRGSYGLDTEAETREAEDSELAKLESGEWVALGCIVEKVASCGEYHETDSLWGIVINPTYAELDAFARHSMELETAS